MFFRDVNRKFNWASSLDAAKTELLRELEIKMNDFYSSFDKRELYQRMLEEDEDKEPDHESVRYQLPLYISKNSSSKILEVGCSNGRLYRMIKKMGFSGEYTGIDLPDYILSANKTRHPECSWIQASSYNLPFKNNSYDIVFSLYVLEHLIYPEKALLEQLRVIKPGGKAVLVFPDFVCSGRLGSQQLGYSSGTFKTKIRKGRFIDGLISLYDSRLKLPRELKKAISKYGEFPVNLSPVCLRKPNEISADVDAVYISSKSEIIRWASAQGYKVDLPCGNQGEYSEQSFIVIHKS